MPIFWVKSVKIYTGQKNLLGYTRGSRDKYEVWMHDIEIAKEDSSLDQFDILKIDPLRCNCI